MPATYSLIAKTLITGNTTSSFNFSNIPQTFRHLELLFTSRQTVDDYVYIRLNGATSTAYNYLREWYSNANFSITGNNTINDANGFAYYGMLTSSTANLYSGSRFKIPNYVSAATQHVCIGDEGNQSAQTSGFQFGNFYSMLFNQTTAITSINIRTGTGNFVDGSAFYLYGIADT